MKKFSLYNSQFNSQKESHPLVCRAAGCAMPHEGYQEFVSGNVKDYCGMFWCSSGSAEFEFSGNPVRVFAGDIVCYVSGESHRIKVANSGFVYYWAVWNGVLAESFLAALKIVSGEKIHMEESLTEKFDMLFDTLRSNTEKSSIRGAAIIYEILANAATALNGEKLSDVREETVPLVGWFRNLVMSEFNDPALNLDAISARLGVHRSTLDRVVKKHLGMAPGEYLQDFRIKVALGKLKTSIMPVNEIGSECGFSTPAYFSKVVKARTGLTPKKFRETGVISNIKYPKEC